MADVLSIVINIVLACVIAQLVEKSIHNSRVEKDFFINELNNINDIYVELERKCSKDTTLSLQNTTYDLGRSSRNLQRMCNIMKEVYPSFHKSHNNEIEEISKLSKSLNTKLTDTTFFTEEDGYEPIKIVKNNIYLNNTVKLEIGTNVSEIKEKILRLKISINKI